MSYIDKKNMENFLEFLNSENFEDIINSEEFNLTGDRVEYNLILNYVEKLSIEDKDKLYNNAKMYKRKKEKTIDDNITRILDYVLLEVPRSKKYYILNEQIIRSQTILRDLRVAERTNDERMKVYETKTEKIQSDFISILSIFSAVIIAFFGGISVLGSVFSNVDKISRYKLVFIVLIIGFIMFNLIYMLLHCISKFTGKTIGVNILENKCYGCYENYFIKCLATKYPMVFIYNISTLFICFLTLIAYIIDKYNVITYIIEFFDFIPNEISLVPLVGLVISVILLMILYKPIKKIVLTKKWTCHNRECQGNG